MLDSGWSTLLRKLWKWISNKKFRTLFHFVSHFFSNKRLSCKQISSLLPFFLPKRFPFDLFYSWNFFANKRDSNFPKYFLRGLDLSRNKNPSSYSSFCFQDKFFCFSFKTSPKNGFAFWMQNVWVRHTKILSDFFDKNCI